MCDEPGHPGAAALALAAPRPAEGTAVDPIALEPVDELEITVLTDNTYDALLTGTEVATRAGLGATARVPAEQYLDGQGLTGLIAEHGFSAVVRTRRGDREHTLLFDTGISPEGMATNGRRLDVDPSLFEAVVLSHGHGDHTGGFPGLRRWLGRIEMPLVLHPSAWLPRRISPPGAPPLPMPTLSRRSLTEGGFTVVERREPSLLLDRSVLITGEVDRTTDFERGMPFHEARVEDTWRPDPWITDDQALVVHLRGRGLVVLTGCGHAGAVNIARHALRLTGHDHLHALLGGLHLTGPGFTDIIEPTVTALTALAPEVVVPAHCTGWRAQMRLAAALPEAYTPGAVGSRYRFTA